MVSLAVFDFDRTIVDDDSDATIISRLREKQPPPEWDSTNHDWTPYMSDVDSSLQSYTFTFTDHDPETFFASTHNRVFIHARWWKILWLKIFEHAYSAGLSEDDILSAIATMRPTPGMAQLLAALSAAGWDVLVLTDANTVFVKHWLKAHGLQDTITEVITNRAFFQNGRLYIEPCMRQTACPRCPSNLCKSLALAQWCAKRPPYERVVYSGDGRNDYCPATNLPESSIVFPRRGFPLDDVIKRTLCTSTPQVRARVVPWDHCRTIMAELALGDVIDTSQ